MSLYIKVSNHKRGKHMLLHLSRRYQVLDRLLSGAAAEMMSYIWGNLVAIEYSTHAEIVDYYACWDGTDVHASKHVPGSTHERCLPSRKDSGIAISEQQNIEYPLPAC